MFPFHLLTLIVLVCRVAGGQAAEDLGGQSTRYAIDIKSFYGSHLQFPYFVDNLEEELSPELKTQLNDVSSEIMRYLDRLVNHMLLNKVSFVQWFEVSRDLYKIMAKLPKEGVAICSRIGFNTYIMNTVGRMMSESRMVERELKRSKTPKDPAKLNKEVHAHIEGVIESIQASPVSIFVAWPEGVIDNVSAETVAVNLMGKLRYYGYSGLLSVVEQVLKVVLMFSKIG